MVEALSFYLKLFYNIITKNKVHITGLPHLSALEGSSALIPAAE